MSFTCITAQVACTVAGFVPFIQVLDGHRERTLVVIAATSPKCVLNKGAHRNL